MIYYVQTNLDKTISNVSKRFKQGYIFIDVPNVWLETFLNNFNDFWVDTNSVLHKPGNIKPKAEITTVELKKYLDQANSDINIIKSSTADNSSAFSIALNSKADKGAINSVQDTLIAVSSNLATLSDVATKEELSALSSKVKSNYTPLVDSLTQLNSAIESKADINSLSSFVIKSNFSSTNASFADSVSNGLSSLDNKKADSTKVGSLETNLNNKLDSKANQNELAQLSYVVDNKAATDYVDSKVTSFENSMSIANNSNALVLNSKATVSYVDDKSRILLSSLGSLDSKTADSSSLKSLADNFSLSNSKIRAELTNKADAENVKSVNDTLLNSINQLSDIKANAETLESVRGNLQNQINTFNDEGSGVVKNVGTLQEEIKGKANQHDLDTVLSAVNDKVSKADFDLGLNRKADNESLNSTATSIANNVSSKANQEAIGSVDGRINSNTHRIAIQEDKENSDMNSLSNITNGKLDRKEFADFSFSTRSNVEDVKNNISNLESAKADKSTLDETNKNIGSVSDYAKGVSDLSKSNLNKIESLLNDKYKNASTYRGIFSGNIFDLINSPSGRYWLTSPNQNSPAGDSVWGEIFVIQLNEYDTMLICYIDNDVYYTSTAGGSWKVWSKVINNTDLNNLKSQINNKADKSDINELRADLNSVASKASSPSVNLSSYATKSDSDKIAQQKIDQLYNNLNNKINSLASAVAPMASSYAASVSASSVAQSKADSEAAVVKSLTSSPYTYSSKPFFLIGDEKNTGRQGYTSEMITKSGFVIVPGMDTNKSQNITIKFKGPAYASSGMSEISGYNNAENTITFTTSELLSGKLQWSSNSKNSLLITYNGNGLLFKCFDGTYSTRVRSFSGINYYAVIESITVTNN